MRIVLGIALFYLALSAVAQESSNNTAPRTISYRCESPVAQAGFASKSRDSGGTLELFTTAMPRLTENATISTKQGHSILRDVFTLKELDSLSHQLIRERICTLGGKATSAVDFPEDIKASLNTCQTKNISNLDARWKCIEALITPAMINN